MIVLSRCLSQICLREAKHRAKDRRIREQWSIAIQRPSELILFCQIPLGYKVKLVIQVLVTNHCQ